MKKLWIVFVAMIFVVTLSACSDGSEETTASDSNKKDTGSETKKDEDKSDENVEESEIGKSTIVHKNKEVNKKVESGPMKLEIKAVQTANLEIAKDYQEMFENKEKVTSVAVKAVAENTSEDTISFYPDQAVMTTNTGEQVDADLFFSDDVGGDFHGKVKKEGDIIFILDSPAEEIKEIKLIINGAHDQDFNNVGDEVKLTLETK